MPDTTLGVVKVGGGLVVGVVSTILGIRRIINPCLENMQKDIDELKTEAKLHLSQTHHADICALNKENIAAQFKAQRDHIDTLFRNLQIKG